MPFNYAPFNDEKSGCKPIDMIVREYADDKIEDGKLVKSTKTINQFTRSKSSPNAMEWKEESGTVALSATFESIDPSARRIVFRVQNLSNTRQISKLDFQLPFLSATNISDQKMYTGYRGGGPGNLGLKDWNHGQGVTGAWPGYCTSPVATLWNEKTKETLGITFFNEQLMSVGIYWFSGPGANDLLALNPNLRFDGELEPQMSMTLPVEFRELSGGPPAHWEHYRKNFLQPFMATLGYPESSKFDASGVWGMGSNSQGGLTIYVRRLADRYKLTGYIQWPGSDEFAAFFEPHAINYPFFSEFLQTSQIRGLKHFGTLVIPNLGPLFPTDMALEQKGSPHTKDGVYQESALALNQRADLCRQYNLKYAKILRDHGVTIAYYDVGGGPHLSQLPLDWLRTYADFQRAGIAVMGECGADVSAWISGVWFEYPYSWNDYEMVKQILPGGGRFAWQHTADKHDVGHGSESWWKDAARKGITPLLSDDELAEWSRGE